MTCEAMVSEDRGDIALEEVQIRSMMFCRGVEIKFNRVGDILLAMTL